jgi:hypothetical protein
MNWTEYCKTCIQWHSRETVSVDYVIKHFKIKIWPNGILQTSYTINILYLFIMFLFIIMRFHWIRKKNRLYCHPQCHSISQKLNKRVSRACHFYSWFQTLAVFQMLYSSFGWYPGIWILCADLSEQSVTKLGHTQFRCLGITQNKEYNMSFLISVCWNFIPSNSKFFSIHNTQT